MSHSICMKTTKKTSSRSTYVYVVSISFRISSLTKVKVIKRPFQAGLGLLTKCMLQLTIVKVQHTQYACTLWVYSDFVMNNARSYTAAHLLCFKGIFCSPLSFSPLPICLNVRVACTCMALCLYIRRQMWPCNNLGNVPITSG